MGKTHLGQQGNFSLQYHKWPLSKYAVRMRDNAAPTSLKNVHPCMLQAHGCIKENWKLDYNITPKSLLLTFLNYIGQNESNFDDKQSQIAGL